MNNVSHNLPVQARSSCLQIALEQLLCGSLHCLFEHATEIAVLSALARIKRWSCAAEDLQASLRILRGGSDRRKESRTV
eukprot:6492537-Amphidinium_carterae.3